jgi:multidrug efflux pump subunit AcrB
VAGRLAAGFLDSKLTPLLLLGSLALGLYAVLVLPREEEPQIVVPMVDVSMRWPGASARDVEQRLTRPIEKVLWEVPGVEYLYSTSSPGSALLIVRFVVGEDEERALVRLQQKLDANRAQLPSGADAPLVQMRSIDDVPVVALTMWSQRDDDFQLRLLAGQVREALAEVQDVSEVGIAGGRTRQVGVTIDPARLSAAEVDALQVARALESAGARRVSTGIVVQGQVPVLQTGNRLDDVDAVGNVVVSSTRGRTILVRDVAEVADADADPDAYVRHHDTASGTHQAVTISIAKRKGANAITVAREVESRVRALEGTLIPSDVTVSVTRNYGETAAEKSNELLYHMFLAVASVTALIGLREAGVVLTAIPVTLALTLFAFALYGYTLNRITLFALIFSIGILVDDAIVVVENIVRHARAAGGRSSLAEIAVRAVDEVGNPTILATLTVVAAILPMAFVGGLMGPYMRPIPVGASAAMLFSLAAAFIVTPWAAVRLLRHDGGDGHEQEDRLTRLYRRVMSRLIGRPQSRWLFLGAVAMLLLLSVAFVPLQWVTVKMLPFDNKSEFQVIIDLPEGTALEETARVAADLATLTLEDPAVTDVQSYVGTSSPYNFNGLVRHYFLRRNTHMADLQVNLRPKDQRDAQSHAVARRVRDRLLPAARRAGAVIQVSEVPPGPPVLQTLVAEVYGPDPDRRRAVADDVRKVFEATDGVVDVDWYVEAPQEKVVLAVDEERAAAAGVSTAEVTALVALATTGRPVAMLADEYARDSVPVVLRLPLAERGSLEGVRALRAGGSSGATVGDLTTERTVVEDASVYHKNLRPVTYVTGDLAGDAESPVYAILQMNRALASMDLPDGYAFEILNTVQPSDSARYAMKWDGEWHITYEVFRDLGLAFAAVLVLIYLLVVWWFQSFGVPLTIMAAIPFSLVGILPAHAAMGAFFTATSMIGFIAGAGIVVRNSIILVDFIELRLREGMSLEEAVVDAGAVRFRPMALTAAAVMAGSAVILFDPIFQGLAISLMAGEVASLLLSRMTVPVLYYVAHRRHTVREESVS